MKFFRTLLIVSLLIPALPVRAATDDDEGWKAFGHALTLAQVLMGIAARSDNPDKAFDDVLAGRNTEANRAIAGMLEEATADMPPEYRGRVASMGQDLAALARRNVGKAPAAQASVDSALQARKDLTAMGLRYHDPKDFLDAVSRDDTLAVELFIAGRGVNLGAKDWRGRTALDIARDRGNQPMAELLARNLPAAR
jgi:ankyrin repeat protein